MRRGCLFFETAPSRVISLENPNSDWTIPHNSAISRGIYEQRKDEIENGFLLSFTDSGYMQVFSLVYPLFASDLSDFYNNVEIETTAVFPVENFYKHAFPTSISIVVIAVPITRILV